MEIARTGMSGRIPSSLTLPHTRMVERDQSSPSSLRSHLGSLTAGSAHVENISRWNTQWEDNDSVRDLHPACESIQVEGANGFGGHGVSFISAMEGKTFQHCKRGGDLCQTLRARGSTHTI